MKLISIVKGSYSATSLRPKDQKEKEEDDLRSALLTKETAGSMRGGYGKSRRKQGWTEAEGNAKVPKGYFAVYVGDEMRRHVLPVRYLCKPAFVDLMERAAEEFGFQQTGALRIPCQEQDFQRVLRMLDRSA